MAKLSALSQAEITTMSPSELAASLHETPDEEVLALPAGISKYIELALRAGSPERKLYEQPQNVEQKLRGLLSGQTLGLSEIPIAAGKAAVAKLRGDDFGKAYEQEIAQQEQYSQEDILPEIAGGLIPSPINIGAKVIGLGMKGAKALTKAIPSGAIKNIIEPILGGALGGAGTASISETAGGDLEAKDVGVSGAIGGALSALPVAGKGLLEGAKIVGKAIPTLTGVPYERVGKYLERTKEIEALTPNRVDFIDETVQAVSDLKDRVVNQSKIARRVLSTSDKDINLNRTNRLIEALKSRLELRPGKVAGPSAQASVENLSSVQKTIEEFDGIFDAKTARKVIDELDDTINYIEKSGDFTDAVSNNLSKVRRSVDLELKRQVPEYAQKMKPLADDTKLLNEVLKKKLNNPETAANILPTLDRPKAVIKRELLDKLSKKTGANLLQTADDYQTLEAFEKTYPQGSARTLLFGGLGALLGLQTSSAQPAGMGFILGFLADKYGPQAARSVLKGVSAMGKPTIEKMSTLLDKIPEIPQSAKDAFKSTIIQQRLERE